MFDKRAFRFFRRAKLVIGAEKRGSRQGNLRKEEEM